MATISLYASKINQMPGVLGDVGKSVSSFKKELSAFKKKAQTVSKNICNLDDVISSVQSATQIQEEKMEERKFKVFMEKKYLTGVWGFILISEVLFGVAFRYTKSEAFIIVLCIVLLAAGIVATVSAVMFGVNVEGSMIKVRNKNKIV